MIYLKQSTAVNIKIGPFLDDTDGKTAETALTIAQADVRISKNGGANAQKNSSTATSHNELGYYNIHLSATDTDTLGSLKLMVQKAGALPVWAEFSILHAKAYDAMFTTGLVELIAAYDNAKTAATQGDLEGAKEAIQTDIGNIDIDTSELAKSSEVEAAKNAIIEAMPDIDLSTIPDDLLGKIIVGELTVEQVLKVLAAIELGTTIGGGTYNITYTGKDGTKVTLSGVDENGNRDVVNVEFED